MGALLFMRERVVVAVERTLQVSGWEQGGHRTFIVNVSDDPHPPHVQQFHLLEELVQFVLGFSDAGDRLILAPDEDDPFDVTASFAGVI